MAATRLIRGIHREIWRELVAQTPGDGAIDIPTGIRIGAGQLCRVQGVFTCDVPTGTPTWTVVPSRSAAGFLVVTVTNTAGGGNNGTWTLDVRLVQSPSQANQGATQGSPGTAGYILISNGATSGLAGTQTLAATYIIGGAAADQTMVVTDADGGGIIVDGSTAAATVASVIALEVRQQDLDIALPFLLSRRGDFANPAALVFQKARGTFTPDAVADVQAVDLLGCIDFYGRINGAMQIGAQIIATVASVAGAALDGALEFYASVNNASALLVRMETPAGGQTLVTCYGVQPIVQPDTTETGSLGQTDHIWDLAYVNTAFVYDNLSLGGASVLGGADHTIVLPNSATMPVPQIDQISLGSVDFGGASGTSLACLALTTEEPLIAIAEIVATHLVPVKITDTSGAHSYYLLAFLDEVQ